MYRTYRETQNLDQNFFMNAANFSLSESSKLSPERGFWFASRQSPGMCPVLLGHFHGQIPAKIPAGKCEITLMALKPRSSTVLRDQTWGQNMALKPRYVPIIPSLIMGAGLTNDWCIT